MTIAGAVELLSNDKIVGWALDTASGHPARIDFCIDGQKVKTLKALRKRPGFGNLVPDGRVEFQFRVHQSLTRYIQAPGSVSFKVGGQELPIVSNTLEVPAKARPLSELLKQLESGHVVTKKGKVQLSIHLDTEWQDKVFKFYDYARKRFQELFQYDLHITYGTLLGHVRERDFIPGDDDFDTAYLSRHTDPKQVKKELIHIASTLLAAGEQLTIARRKIIQWRGPDGISIDVFPAWLEGKNFYMSFAVGAPCADALKAGFAETEFRGHKVLAPVKAREVLAGIYGAGWETPDPYFQWVTPKSVRAAMRAIQIDDAAMAEIYWNRVYRAGTGSPPPSSFATLVSKKVPEAITGVIEIGCGNGRDTLEVAGPKRLALGLDYSQSAVNRNRETWSAKEFPLLSFEQADVRDIESLRNASREMLKRNEGPIAVYSRFFIHAIDDEGEATLRQFLEEKVPAGSVLYFEFRTHLDAVLEKTFGDHFRRFVNPDDFVARMTASGKFRLTDKEVGTGLAVYKDEDPHVARLYFQADR